MTTPNMPAKPRNEQTLDQSSFVLKEGLLTAGSGGCLLPGTKAPYVSLEQLQDGRSLLQSVFHGMNH